MGTFGDVEPAISASASADFVARTLREVMDERETVDREAARVDEYRFPAGFLSRFELPPIASDFVMRTVRAIERDRAEGPALTSLGSSADVEPGLDSQLAPEHDLEQLLRSYGPEAISDQFVERTLDALASQGDPMESAPGSSAGIPDLDAFLASYGPATFSPDFVERTVAAIEHQRRAPTSPNVLRRASSSASHSEHRWTARGAVLRLAAAALLAAGIVFFSQGPSDRPSNDEGSGGRVARVESGPNAASSRNDDTGPGARPGALDGARHDSRHDALYLATSRLSEQFEPTRPATVTAGSVDPLLVLMRKAALGRGPQSATSPETRRNR